MKKLFARVVYLDGRTEEAELLCQGDLYSLAHEPDFLQVRHIDFFPDLFHIPVGSNGYYIVPKDIEHDTSATGMIRFRPRKDRELVSPNAHSLPVMGAFLPQGATAVALRGGQFLARFVAGVKNGIYYAYPRFVIEGEAPYEPLSVLIHRLPLGADYSDLARFFRQLRISDGCVPLREKAAQRPEVRYAVQAPYLRIRLGWKPVPSPEPEQTPENEPEMYVATTFRQVGALVDALKEAGVEKAELCLVGWNVKGHDGRYPQMFPVEEALGGEGELRQLIVDTQAKGYQITAHTASADSYRISADWNEEDLIRRKDGSVSVNPYGWSGGRMYDLCYTKSLDFARRDLPRVARLGFRGLHYIDVISIVPPRPCYHPEHPLNAGESAACARQLARYASKQFGGFCSEGGYDFLCPELDYALNPVRGLRPLTEEDLFDRYVPLWHMVYHGILLYNVMGETINYPIRPQERHLQVIEYGARPTIYFSQMFTGDWQTMDDFRCGTPEDLSRSVKLLRQVWDEYSHLSPLQYEFIEKHEFLPNNTVRVTYSDGSVITVDYGNENWKLEKGQAFASPAAE